MALINTTTTGVLGTTVFGDGSGDLTIQQNGVLVNKITSNGLTYRGTGSVLQVVNTQSGAVATGTTIIPGDDTIPQITEGTEYITLAITPTSATSKLLIQIVWMGATTVPSCTIALFQDATVNALAATISSMGAGSLTSIPLNYFMTAGTTSSTTFRLRFGSSNAATTTTNGQAGGRFYGGVSSTSMTITEIAA